MVPLMLVLAPAACNVSGKALSQVFVVFSRSIKFKFQLPGEPLNSRDVGDAAQPVVLKHERNGENKRKTLKKEQKEGKEASTEALPLACILEKALVLHLVTSVIALFLILLLSAFYVVGLDDLMRHAQIFRYANGNNNPPTAVDLEKSLLRDLFFNQSPAKACLRALILLLIFLLMDPLGFLRLSDTISRALSRVLLTIDVLVDGFIEAFEREKQQQEQP